MGIPGKLEPRLTWETPLEQNLVGKKIFLSDMGERFYMYIPKKNL
jgi:hypothetical protein